MFDIGNILADIDKQRAGQLYGKPYEYWEEKLGITGKELANMIASLGKRVGTAQREGINRAGELSAQYDLTPAAQIAMESGANIGAERAIAEGTAGIEQYGAGANRRAWETILQGESGETAMERQMALQQEMADENFWNSLITGVGSTIPLLFI